MVVPPLNNIQRVILSLGGIFIIIFGAFDHEDDYFYIHDRPAIPFFLGFLMLAVAAYGLKAPRANRSIDQPMIKIPAPDEYQKKNEVSTTINIESQLCVAKQRVLREMIRSFAKNELHIDYVYLSTYAIIFFSYLRSFDVKSMSNIIVEGGYNQLLIIVQRDEPYISLEEFEKIVWYVNAKCISFSSAKTSDVTLFSTELSGVVGRSPFFRPKMQKLCDKLKDVYIEASITKLSNAPTIKQ